MALNVTYKGLLKLALPIAAGTFIQFLVVLTDNVFLSRIGQNQMNGAGNGSLMYITFLMGLIGLSSGIQILVARRKGEQNYMDAGAIFANGLVLAAIIGVFVFVLLQIMSRFAFVYWIDSPEVLDSMQKYVNVRSLGMIIYFIPLIAIGFYTGIAKTMVVLYATVITAGINVILDYFFIFGVENIFGTGLSIPRMEVEGACWATITAEFIATIYVIIYMLKDKDIKKYGIPAQLKKIPTKFAGRILKVSSPLMFQQMISLATWTFFFFIIEKSGENNLQISHVIRTLYMLVFVSGMGFGQATKSVISTLIAEKRLDETGPAIRKLIIANLVGVLILSHGLWLYPDLISELFQLPIEAYSDARTSMMVILFSMVIMAFSAILLNVVIGSGNTQKGFFIELFAVVFYLTGVYVSTIIFKWPVYQIWMNDYIYFGVIMVLSFLFIKNSKWKYLKI